MSGLNSPAICRMPLLNLKRQCMVSKGLLYSSVPLEVRSCLLHDAQKDPSDWPITSVNLVQDEMQHDVQRFNSKIQQYLAALKNWDIDLKTGSSSSM